MLLEKSRVVHLDLQAAERERATGPEPEKERFKGLRGSSESGDKE